MRLLIRQGYIIDPVTNFQGEKDILIEEGKIKEISSSIEQDSEIVIEAKGKWVIPGLIDLHAHLREPGREDEETIYTGGRAGVKGGYITI